MSDLKTNNSQNSISKETLRKLPPEWKKANLIWQIVFILIGAVNIVLTSIDDGSGNKIPILYFEIMSCFLAIAPIIWSKILDQVKQYQLLIDNTEDISTTSKESDIRKLNKAIKEIRDSLSELPLNKTIEENTENSNNLKDNTPLSEDNQKDV